MKILLLEDDQKTGDYVSKGLTSSGHVANDRRELWPDRKIHRRERLNSLCVRCAGCKRSAPP
jgi:DNA-binding response OmpR family regulator